MTQTVTSMMELHDELTPERRALLALRLRQKNGQSNSVELARCAENPSALSPGQLSIWLKRQLGGDAAFSFKMAFRLRGPVEIEGLRRSVEQVVRRHEILRTRFVLHDENPVQEVLPPRPWELAVEEASGSAEEVLQKEVPRPFNLENGEVLRTRLFRLAPDEHLFVVSLHHIAIDGWSSAILVKELGMFYEAWLQAVDPALPPLEIQYADYATWRNKRLKGERLQSLEEFWKQQLDGALPLDLPTDFPRPPRLTYAGARASVVIGADLTARIRSVSREAGASVFMTLLAVWQAVLSLWSGQKDLVATTFVADRGVPKIQDLIGFFVNTVLIRSDLSGNPTFSEFLARVKRAALAAYDHQELPIEYLREKIQSGRDLNRANPFIENVFGLQAQSSQFRLAGIDVEAIVVPEHTVGSEASLQVYENGAEMTAVFDYSSELWRPATAEQLLQSFARALESIAENPQRRIVELLRLPEDERLRLVEKQERTSRTYPRKTIVDYFEAQVERSPDAIAIVTTDRRISYGSLNAEANRVAQYLYQAGVRQGDVVAICVGRGPEMLFALLGVLKTGAAYLPLHPDNPATRTAYMLSNSGVRLIIADRRVALNLGETSVAIAWWDDCQDHVAPHDPQVALPGADISGLAYVIYTSGTTGEPKGVMVPHASLANAMHAFVDLLAMKPEDSTLALTALSFDIAGLELFAPLVSGGQVIIVPEAVRSDAYSLGEFIKKTAPTLIQATPSTLEILKAAGWQPPKGVRVLSGGEALQSPLAGYLIEGGSELWNMYGPTETTIWSLAAPLSKVERGIIPIGSPVANTQVYVLDEDGEPIQEGRAGEIAIGGEGLAWGYMNRASSTAAAFIPDSLSSQIGGRLYKTGDLGRWNSDGQLEFIGRRDSQVKIRGHRIELGEIETVLKRQPNIGSCAVKVDNKSSNGELLIAYVVPSNGTVLPEWAELRAALAKDLPPYMLPDAIVPLPEMPLLPSGKIDRRALKYDHAASNQHRPYIRPRTELEELIAQAWAEVLRVERVGRADNFFELGGHSLKAMRLIAHLRQALGAEVTIGDLFARPSLADFAAFLSSAPESKLPAIPSGNPRTNVPLSFAQQRIWFLLQMEGISPAYNIPLTLRLQGRLNRAALRRALDRLVARHEALRTTLHVVEGHPVQCISPVEGSYFQLQEHDLTQHADAEAETRRLIVEEALQKFDLEAGPLVCGRLVQQNAEQNTLLITMHHIVSDGWSIGILLQELKTLYGAFVRGENDPLPELTVQYADYAFWQKKWIDGEIRQQHADFWKNNLAGAPELLILPSDRARPPRRTLAGALAKVELDAELTAGLRALSSRHGVTLFTTLLAGWAVLLARLSGQNDLLIGTPLANRDRMEVESVIGLFVNTVVLRVDTSGSPTVATLLDRVKKQVFAAQQHQEIPFEQMVKMVNPVRTLAHSPLFQVMLLWQNAPEEDFELPGLSVAQIDPESHVVSKFDLTMILQEAGNRIAGALEYDTALFEESTINRYLGYFRTVLEGMAAGGDHQFVDRLPMLGEEERKQVLYEWNQPQRDYPRDQCVHELFEEQVGRSPNAIAVQYEDVSLSYIELNRQANQLGHYLRKLGVGPEVRVGICLERSLDMVVAVMGVLKAGGAYVPLDPGYPHERLQFMVEDSHPAVLISQRSLKQRLSLDQAGLLCLEDIREEISHCSCEKLESGVAADNLAYLIYTSGSTGRPKGTMVTHGNVMRLLRATEPWFGFDAQDVWTMFHSYAFDFSVWELWGALAYGGRLVVVPYWVSRSPGAFYTLVKQCGVTILNQTPSAFQQFSREDEGRQEELKLRLVIFGGEALEMSSLLPWMERHGDETPRMVNMYGITETTVHVTYQVLAKDLARGKASVIGERIPDLQLYILRDMEPVPVGAAGEIYVGGAGLARGYWKRAGLTAERFMPNPFSEREGARLYKTGDLGRYRQDGNIEYLGRIDQQVKIRGFRIELGEIEAQLAQCGGVAESVVVASEHVPGERRLVAYYTLEKGIAEQDVPDAQALREHLSQTLPDYMVPAEFVRLERLPLTENRKLDRKALPPPESNRRTERGYEAPLGDLETAIARIWADVLQVERISRDDNFFKLGGHSLSAVRLAGRIKQELETDVTVRHLFEFPSVAALAKQLQENATRNDPSLESIVPVLRTDAVPLSYGQHQLWVVQQFNPGSTAYHIPSLFHLHGNLNTEILERSFSEIVRRHEILRTSFPTRQRHPVQRIEAPRRLLFPLVDLATLPADERSLAFDRLIDEDCKQPFSLASGPLIRFLLVRLSDQHHALLITLHHIVADAWSIPILVRELTAIYSALLKGKQNPLVDLPIQYADYALWLSGQTRSAAFARSLQYWRDQLAGAPVLKLPCEDAGDEEQAEGAVREISIPADVLQRLHELGEREGYTLFMTLLACWQILLARYCDETDIVIGAPVANRPTPDLYGLIGYFVNTVALRTDLSGDPSFHEVMQRIRTVVLDAHTHQQIPFEYLVAELKPPRDPGQAPFFRAVFTFLNFESVPYALPQLRIESQAVRKFTAKFDLELSATEHDGRVDLSFIYKRQIFREELVERMLNDYLALLRGLVETPSSSIWNVDLCEPAVQSSLPQTKRSSIQQQPETPVALAPAPAAADGRIENKSEGIEGKIAATLLDIPLEGEQRMEQFVAEYNRTEAAYESRCFHELFEAQVTSRPQGTAVIFGDERVTYQELNERANQLAHYLREQGVGPEKWVGLCLDRSIEMVVAMLGVMKAGGGYVPLDPGYPKQRLAYMLSDSAPALVVGMGRPLDFGEMFDLGERQNILQNYATVNPEGIADLQNPVALIYTSGSTGVPKGVTISHAALTNHMQWMSRTFGISSKDRILQKAPISFDASITELCLPLMTGGILVLAKPGGQQDSGYLVDLIIEQEITVAQFVPSLMEFMVRERNFTQCTTLKWLLSGAEPLPRTLATKVHDMLGLDIMNLYGPTEVTIDAIFCQVTPEHERVMVGKPIGNMRAYVLNENGQPAPVGEVGEIYIGGVQLARGYWARPELTAERFIPDAVSGTPGERLYRTGDLGRWGTDGELECLGRCDDQIKIRGCRVERGEIETRLRAYPGVTQTAIRLWRDAEGQNHLIAYLVGASRELTSRQVRRDLADSLPEYMLPTHVIFLEVAPLTPSGKLDARSLPLPQVSSAAEENVARSDRSTESIVLSIWRQILATEEFGLDDNFFDIGGNSFLLLEVRQKLCAQLGINISVPDMLRFATVRSLSESLKPELQTYSSSQ